jgi:hypothetical protein
MKIDAVTRKVNALAVGQSLKAANTFKAGSCSICASPMYLAHNSPSLPTFFKCPIELVNIFNDY